MSSGPSVGAYAVSARTIAVARTMRAGIVGLPNVGKSTLFNALTSSKQAQSANYPFCTIEPNEGVVSIPDDRLERISR